MFIEPVPSQELLAPLGAKGGLSIFRSKGSEDNIYVVACYKHLAPNRAKALRFANSLR